jgi:hypothetical protein
MSIVYANGTQDITVAALDCISATSDSPFSIFQQVGYPNQPNSWSLLDSVDSAPFTYTSSVLTNGGAVRIEAGATNVSYVMGTGAVASVPLLDQGAPTAMTTAATITIAGLMSGIITGTHTAGATAAYTLPTGTVTDAGVDMAIGQSFDWVLINLSAAAADTITLTAAAGGSTIVGNPIVQSAHASTGAVYGNSAQFRTRKTAAETFVTYRIA